MQDKKISLFLAILININIVIGAAFFIESPLIATRSGSLAPFSWLFVGLLLLPLIMVLSHLAKAYPVAGGLYIYSQKELSDFWGFVSGWGYYIGTAAGNAMVLSSFRGQLEAMQLSLGLSGFSLDCLLVVIFSLINLCNIELLGAMQWLFTSLKAVPIVIALIGSVFLMSPSNFPAVTSEHVSGLFTSIPLVLFAYLGIEACCAIGHVIKDGQKNASKAILTSFGLIIAIYTIIQFCLIGIHGTEQAHPFSAIIPMLTSNPTAQVWLIKLINLSLLSSFLGGFYSMFYANNWNLYTMAQEKSLPYARFIATCNRFKSPIISIAIQALLIIGLLALTQNLATLTTMSDFGIIIAYLLSTIAFLGMCRNNKKLLFLGFLSSLSCLYLLFVCNNELMHNGLACAVPFMAILCLGLVLYATRSYQPKS